LPAVRTRHRMCALFGPFVEKIALFHAAPRRMRCNLHTHPPCNPASVEPLRARVLHNHGVPLRFFSRGRPNIL
jgi:hypothetical protein